MDYDSFVDLDNVTIGDCLDLFNFKDIATVINDGRIVTFEKEGVVY